jgi:D-arabinose 1-dehydrogenase-like Zn-dependent alcohol dehydrogenase
MGRLKWLNGKFRSRVLATCGSRRAVKGWYSGTAIDSQDTLRFRALAGVRSMNEVYPLEKAAEGYDWMMSGKARFRWC